MDELEKDVEANLPEDAEVDPDLLIPEDEATLDEDEVDPFKDKWEE